MSMDHPRIRGEHSTRWSPPSWNPGSSPHTRGAHFEVVVDPIQLGIIPAYAGSTPATRPAPRRCEDHPRIRGEHGKASFSDGLPSGSSPQTRGAPPPTQVGVETTGIIPAYAGSTFAGLPGKIVKADHPRIRGEHAIMHVYPPVSRGSSPHTRGALSERFPLADFPGIIPAYAGSTSRWTTLSGRARDHPRIRGEHHRLGCAGDFGHGSSPHTRGAHQRAPVCERHQGIIPAYAGSTSS